MWWWQTSGKRQLVLYVDDELITIAKAKGINLSILFNDTLKSVLELPENLEKTDVESMIKEKEYQISIQKQQLKAQELEISKLKEEKQQLEKDDLKGWY